MTAKQRIKNERMRPTKAGTVLGYSRTKMWQLGSTGVLTRVTPSADRGRGRPCFVWADEVDVLSTEGEQACRDYRLALGRT